MDLLAAMRVFQKVASVLSFTEASEQLGLSPSSVSRQLDALEAHLGVKLLTRTTRRLALTEPGERYKQRLDDLLSDLEAVHQDISAFAAEPRGRLKVSSPRVFGRRVLAPLIQEFLRRHPQVVVELSLTDDYVDLVETDTDVAVRIGTLGDSSLVSRPLGRYRRVLCCAPAYLARKAAPQHPQELRHHNCLRWRRSGERVVWRFAGPQGGDPSEVLPQGDLVANDMEVLFDAALAGGGIALLPHWLVAPRLASGALIPVLPAYVPDGSQQATGIHFVYALNRRQSRKVHAFMEHVAERAAPLLV